MNDNLLKKIENNIQNNYIQSNNHKNSSCHEERSSGKENFFIDIIYKNKIYCGKKIDIHNPNEFLFYHFLKDNHHKIFQKFKEHICQYYGIYKSINKKEINYYMIIDNLKNGFDNPITIDVKIGGYTFREGENNTKYKKLLFNNFIKSHRHYFLDQIMTISSSMGFRVESITGISKKNNNNILKYNNLLNINNIDIINNSTYNLQEYIENLLKTKSLKNKKLFSSLYNQKIILKYNLMQTNIFHIFHTLLPFNNKNKIILEGFENDLYKLITHFIKNNFNELKKDGSYFSFIGSSILFIYGKYKNTFKGCIKLIDFAHPVNLFIEDIMLKSNKKHIQLVKYSVIDYSIGIINLYIIISFLLLDEKMIFKNRFYDVLKILNDIFEYLFEIKKYTPKKIIYKNIYKMLY